VTAPEDPVPVEERLAQILEHLATECRKLVGTSEGGLPLLREDPQHPVDVETTPSVIEAVEPETTARPILLTRREVADLLRIGERSLARWQNDPRAKFPKPIRRGRVVRWRRVQIDRWLARRES
jgi:predicted DNA-binding transcriptional regulator AlpA